MKLMRAFRRGRRTEPDAAEAPADQAAFAEDAADNRLDAARPPPAADPNLTAISTSAARLGYDVVDIAGFLDGVEAQARLQRDLIGRIRDGMVEIDSATSSAAGAVDEVADAAAETQDLVGRSVEFVRELGKRTRSVAGWVADVKTKIGDATAALKASESHVDEIASVAKEVNILAVNAKIEASRVGEAGRGFAIIADAIAELSRSTASAASAINDSIAVLTEQLDSMSTGASTVSVDAERVLHESSQTDDALGEISSRVDGMKSRAAEISGETQNARGAARNVLPDVEGIVESIAETTGGIGTVHDRVAGLVDTSEAIVQASVALGGSTDDAPFIDQVQRDAAALSGLLETALSDGATSENDLFCDDYRPVPGTEPEQLLAPFTDLTDRLFRETQEKALDLSERIVFCAAVDRNGYLPTHNDKFSKPQGSDPTWNMANCRNRRLFNDRVGLKAGQNTQPFLLQVYRRDMGGGEFRMMKDLSAPITVHGRHWGGLRLAYAF